MRSSARLARSKRCSLHRRSRRPLRLRIGRRRWHGGSRADRGAGLQVRQIAGADRQIQSASMPSKSMHRLGGGFLRGRLAVAAFFSAAGFFVVSFASGDGTGVGEDDQVDVAGAAVVGRLGEPVEHRAGIGGAEQIQVLAASVEHRLADLGEAIGDRERLEQLHRQRHRQRLRVRRVGQPARVRRPAVGQDHRTVDLVGRDLRRRAGVDVDHEQRLGCRCRPACGCRATTSGPSRSQRRRA